MFEFDLSKFKKYDKPGPRYTSYPTAPQFKDTFTAENYLDEIIKTNYGEGLPDLSLYYHLPFCDTLCYFCGCNMIITRNRDRVKEYLKYLKKLMINTGTNDLISNDKDCKNLILNIFNRNQFKILYQFVKTSFFN